METVIVVIMMLAGFTYLLKQTYRKVYSVAFSAVVCALFVGLTWPYAIEQSKSQISGWLANAALMQDIAVVLTLEVILQMAFCLLAAHIQTSGKARPATIWAYRLLRWFPGILIYPVLFSLLVTAIFAMTGTPFAQVAWTLAAVVLAAIPLGTWGLRQLLPEKDIRLELLFLSNALIAILGIIATVNGQTAVAGTGQVDGKALGGLLLLLLTGLAAGWALHNRQMKRTIKKQMNRL